jgi:hypothetical protein
MNAQAFLLIIALALLETPNLSQIGTSISLTEDRSANCASIPGCANCFLADKLICYECSADYIRETRSGETGQCWKYTPREISGYGRDCVICNETNYPKDGQCFPCPFKCKACHYDATAKVPVCDTCKPDLANTPGYNTKDDCSCKDGLSIDDDENVKYCFCNDANEFTFVGDDGTVGCYECGTCFRNFPNCKGKGTCPTKTFDPLTCTSCNKVDMDLLSNSKVEPTVCCQDCDITCETCSGPDRDDCITCRSEGEQLFEWVEEEKQCLCVCHSKEVVEGAVVKCVCNEGRVATLVGSVYQCVCKSGTVDAAAADKDGIVQCVPINTAGLPD